MYIGKTGMPGIFFSAAIMSLSMLAQAAPPTDSPGRLQQRVAKLETLIAVQQQEIDNLTMANTGLTNKLACISTDSNTTDLFFKGCNIHVRNGFGNTDSLNGFGNLIIGYNEDVGTPSDRTGSHNLVVGPLHTYSSYGGFVADIDNSVTGTNASVSGGARNEASADASSVSGGGENTASGIESSVSGGVENTAAQAASSILGGSGSSPRMLEKPSLHYLKRDDKTVTIQIDSDSTAAFGPLFCMALKVCCWPI